MTYEMICLLIDALTTHRGALLHKTQDPMVSYEQYGLLHKEARRCFDASIELMKMRDAHPSHGIEG